MPTLKAIARRHGRPAGIVRVAVNKGLIPKAERHGLGRGKGSEWLYPPGTDDALRLLFRLQKKGYKGTALRFELWWGGAAPFSSAIPKYVSDVLTAPAKDIRFQLNRVGITQQTSELTVGEDDLTLRKGNLGDVPGPFIGALKYRLDEVLRTGILRFLRDSLNEIDPALGLPTDQLGQVVRVSVSTMMKIWPEDLEGSVFKFLAGYLTSKWTPLQRPHTPSNESPLDPELFDRLVMEMHFPEWFDQFVELVRSARPEGYEMARRLIRDDQILGSVMDILGSLAVKSLEQTRNRSRWQVQHMGPWQRPELAVKAMVLGYLIGFAKWIQINTRIDDPSGEPSSV